MSARAVLAVAAILAAGSAWAGDEKETATRVSGGGSSGGSSDSSRTTATRSSSTGSSERSTATRSSSERSTATRSSDRSSSSRSSSARGPETDAQRRHPRPGTGTGRFDFDDRDRGRHGWSSPYAGYGYGSGYGYGRYGQYGRYGYYYNPYDSWYSPYYYSGYYGYSPGYYRRGRGYRDSGSVRVIVEPEETRVYVDGYYAGIADDFDGILQRLNVPPGRHDITLKLEGYRTQHFKVYVPVDDTIKIHYNMVRGSGEATSEEFAGPPDADYARVRDMSDDDRRRDDDRYRRGGDDDYDGRDRGDTGSVRLSVSPRDASVYVDGEFRGSGRDSSSLRLRPGRHRIEVVRPGYRTIEREIEVESGRSTSVAFELERM